MNTPSLKLRKIFEIILVSTLLTIFSYLVCIVYAYPYFSIGSIGGNGAYDGEPDYFANIISTLVNGHSMDFLHPGVPINQISAFFIGIFSSILTVEEVIEFSRFLVLFLNCLMIYAGSRIVLNQELIFSFLLISILILFPAGFFLIDNLSPNGILFGISVLLVSIGSKLSSKLSGNLIIYSIFLGIAISIKYISLIIVIPFLTHLFFDKSNQDLKTSTILSIIFFLVLISFITFSITAWHILPVTPYILTHHGLIFSESIQTLSDPKIIFSILFFLVILLLILKIIFSYLKKYSFERIYQKTCAFLIICLALVVLVNFFKSNSLLSFGYSLRNYFPILGMIVLFISYLKDFKFISSKGFYFFSFVLIFFSFTAKINFNYHAHKDAFNEQSSFLSFISQFEEYDFLAFYPPTEFISSEIFVAWSDYRYGDSRFNFSDEISHFRSSMLQPKVRIINIRKFNLLDPRNKPSYKYFSAVEKSKFSTQSQKNVAINQMNLLTPKNICYELFDGFKRDKKSILFFPESLNSYIEKDEISKSDDALLLVKKLKNDLETKCAIKSEISESFYKDQIFYLIKINSYNSTD